MKHLFRLILSVALIGGFTATSYADQAADNAIKAKIAGIGLQAKSVSNSPLPGIKQVITNRGVFYISENGQHFIAGRIFDLNDGMNNLTEQALSKLRLEGLAEYKDSMIVYPAKDEKYKVTVFTDTTCGYCQKLHREMEDYNKLGITVQYLAFPRGGLYSRSFNDITSVWCAENPQSAMTSAKAGSKITPAKCDAPIAGHYDFGQAAGVSGTPAIVLEDGSMIPGYKPAVALLQVLETN